MTIYDAIDAIKKGKTVTKKGSSALLVWDESTGTPMLLWENGETSVFDPDAADLSAKDFMIIKGKNYEHK